MSAVMQEFAAIANAIKAGITQMTNLAASRAPSP
jgi:hypothetical protein